MGRPFKKQEIWKELESRLKKPIDLILKDWHRKEGYSAPQIKEVLEREFKISNITSRTIQIWLDELGILNAHVRALRNRVVSGRMDYKQRKIDYTKRKIDYELREQRKRMGISPKKKIIVIEAPKYVRDEIVLIAESTRRTISEVVRDIFRISGHDLMQRIKGVPRWHILDLGVKKYKKQLLKGRLKARKAVAVAIRPLSSERGNILQ